MLTAVSACSRPAAPSEPLVVPAEQRYDPPGNERRPLLVVLHGLGSSGKQVFEAFGLRSYGEATRTHVLAPDGNMDSRGRRFWNAVPECCNFDARPIDDVARITELMDAALATGTVDERRIQIIGVSNGGFLAHRLACRLGNRLAAVVSVAGAAPLDASEPCVLEAPLAVLEIHGDADEVVSYAGGHLFGRPELPRSRSVPDTLELWGKRLACDGAPAASGERDLVSSLPGAETEVRSFGACAKGSAELWTIHGGGHIPPLAPTLSALEPYLAQHHR